MHPVSPRILSHDGALALSAPVPSPGLARWFPRFHDSPAAQAGPPRAWIRLGGGADRVAAVPPSRPSFTFDTLRVWVDDDEGHVRLVCRTPGMAGEVDLRGLQARLQVARHEPLSLADAELFTMLTISSAMLLGRLGRALVHAAAVVGPDGGAWLLVGDSHAGKTTTTINLVRGGWGFLSDDHVVAGPALGGGRMLVDGWPRPFHVDEGWTRGEVTGRREPVPPSVFGADRWRRTAPLRGLLFPRVSADDPTRLQPLPSGRALTLLIRQSPWLMADRAAAPALLRLLAAMSRLPAFALSVGMDTYQNSALLAERCRPLLDAP